MKRIRVFSAILLPLALLYSGLIAADPPPTSGAVIRDEVVIGVTWADFDSGLRVILGADIVEFCNGIVDFDIVWSQDVEPPVGEDWVIERLYGEVRAQVFDFVDFDCELFLNNEPIAAGYVMLNATDNDLLQGGPPNANAWGFMAHGAVYSPDGDEFALSAIVRNLYLKKQDRFHQTASIVLH